MSLVHHSATQTYQEAGSAAATAARKLMEAKFEAGRASAGRLFEHVHTAVPVDSIVRGTGFTFKDTPSGLTMGFRGQENGLSIHNNAINQLAQKAGIPSLYLKELADPKSEGWKRDLAADILSRHFGNATSEEREDNSNKRHLVRVVNGQARAVLSDKYRRLNSLPLLDQFAASCKEVGAIPVEGSVTDTRLALKAFLPMVFEPVPNEVMCLGIEWSNSDFGNGKHAVRAFIWRLWCTNFATMEDSLAQVHLGGKMSDNFEFSQKTYESDTKTQVLALKDIIKGVLAPASVNTMLETIKQANDKNIDWKNTSAKLTKKLLKNELKLVKDAFESEDVINLPAGKSIWRMSNAISWIATKTEDADRKLELQRLAGEVINGKADAALEAA